MAQGLVQPAQAIEVGDHQGMVARGLQPFAGQGDEALAVIKARQRIPFGGGEAAFGHADAGGADAAFLQPDPTPDAALGGAHAQTRGKDDARRLLLQEILERFAVLRQGQGGQGGRRALRRQRAKAQGPGGPLEGHAVALGLPDP